LVVASSERPIHGPYDLLAEPPIVGRVTALAKRFKTEGALYAQAFIITMAREIEAAMRRGSFPYPDMVIPDIFVINLMGSNLPKSMGEHFLGHIVYSFSI
jgi:hypothetical protein